MIKTFLFDLQNTGKIPHKKGQNAKPELVWRTRLPSYPRYGAESTCIIDKEENIFFGCHNGLFYCLDKKGHVKWSFFTDGKIYSSPTFCIKQENILFGSGSGYLYCLDKNGNLNWAYELQKRSNKPKSFWFADSTDDLIKKLFIRTRKIISKYQHSEGYGNTKFKVNRIWSSPKVLSNNNVLISGVGKGLHSVDIKSGNPQWTFNLGAPEYHIAGPAVDSGNNIYIPSKLRYLFCINSQGEKKWVHDSGSSLYAWTSPSVDEATGLVFYARSYGEKKAVVYAIDFYGKSVWSKYLNFAVRGNVAISGLDYVLVCDFGGHLNFLSKKDGRVINKIKLAPSDKGLWTTPSISKDNYIFVSSKQSRFSGKIHCINQHGEIIWDFDTGKALSTPVLDANGRLYFGNWNGEFICLQT